MENGQDNEDDYFEEQLYKERYATERNNAFIIIVLKKFWNTKKLR
ncbi:hypothetical protein VSP10_17155 [Myroides odoratimimus]|uniref:Uncharacterized protein n=1 Tax=Myroides odoratimimus CIP 101113 TaxID=883154 RepID=A0AAV3F1S8_9FLAO|nr:hypothetical protein [Myroides odoratimimus]EHO10473.1 hypothetical protein HMPREF9715_02192 [Myroides odoratimimus CIP 101113]MDX4975486.1 hypothetical protein [Myroides odoratimimus]MEC4036363.1 hypothetical protein [Myroides odoratimimus]MEC4054501.1 hypothetical protein [Myroides odoratimimus]MEC4076541.1 hypothetical protein [Myroides odoratimimus]